MLEDYEMDNQPLQIAGVVDMAGGANPFAPMADGNNDQNGE